MLRGSWRIGAIVSGAALAASMILTAAPAGAATGPVSATPASGTPQLAATNTGTFQQIRQLVQCGSTMYAVGTFTPISVEWDDLHPEQRVQLQRHDAVHGHLVGPERQRRRSTPSRSARTAPPPTSAASSARSAAPRPRTSPRSAPRPARSSPGFGHNASGQVETLLYYNGHLLAGGLLHPINSSTANPYMTSLNPTTGKDDGFIHLSISGQLPVPRRGLQPDPGLQPAAQPRRHAGPGRRRLHLGRRACPGSRSSCST